MRIVFMGTSAFSVPSLQSIIKKKQDEIVGVVSRPDRSADRKRMLKPSPLRAFAEQQQLNILTPEKPGEPESITALAALQPDLFVAVAYGQYIPTRIINLARHKGINVHPSLLPKYRGPAPIQWAILNGEKITGVSIIYLAEKMDAGDIIRQKTYPLDDEETTVTLQRKLSLFSADLLLKAIDDIRKGTVSRTIQNETEQIKARKLIKADGEIDWSLPAEQIWNRIRAFNPWPGSFCTLPNGTVIKVWSAQPVSEQGNPGELLNDQFLVSTGSGALRFCEVQPPGGKRMSALAFLNGRPLPKGEFLR